MENRCHIAFTCWAYNGDCECEFFEQLEGSLSCKYAKAVNDVYAMCGSKTAQQKIKEEKK